jgi:hypothetical protein
MNGLHAFRQHRSASIAVGLSLALALASASIGSALAQGAAPAENAPASPPAVAQSGKLDLLKGAWVRPDGGYMIAINGIGADGRLDALYFNPARLPFARAQASNDGATLRVFLELQAGGYSGSTYELAYDPASDQLRGTYYQAVQKQRYSVQFLRR